MARSYDAVVGPYRSNDPGVQQVADAAEAHFVTAYDQAFGVGERIAARREQLHLTQEQVAQRSGIRQSEISRIERGKANPTQSTLEKVAAALDAQIVLAPKAGAHRRPQQAA